MGRRADLRYARERGLPQLLQAMLAHLCESRPADPCGALLQWLAALPPADAAELPPCDFPDGRWGLRLRGCQLHGPVYGGNAERAASPLSGRVVTSVDGRVVHSPAELRAALLESAARGLPLKATFARRELVCALRPPAPWPLPPATGVHPRTWRRSPGAAQRSVLALAGGRWVQWPRTLCPARRGGPRWPHDLSPVLWDRSGAAPPRQGPAGKARRGWPHLLSAALWPRDHGAPPSDAGAASAAATALVAAATGAAALLPPPPLPPGLGLWALRRTAAPGGEAGLPLVRFSELLGGAPYAPGEGLAALEGAVDTQAAAERRRRPSSRGELQWRPPQRTTPAPVPYLAELLSLAGPQLRAAWPHALTPALWPRARRVHSCSTAPRPAAEQRWPGTLCRALRPAASRRVGWPHTLSPALWPAPQEARGPAARPPRRRPRGQWPALAYDRSTHSEQRLWRLLRAPHAAEAAARGGEQPWAGLELMHTGALLLRGPAPGAPASVLQLGELLRAETVEGEGDTALPEIQQLTAAELLCRALQAVEAPAEGDTHCAGDCHLARGCAAAGGVRSVHTGAEWRTARSRRTAALPAAPCEAWRGAVTGAVSAAASDCAAAAADPRCYAALLCATEEATSSRPRCRAGGSGSAQSAGWSEHRSFRVWLVVDPSRLVGHLAEIRTRGVRIPPCEGEPAEGP
eukprot:TRINITY_DN2920_c1_g1_i1.p1 TRINITY_DN2920_c1_g1~~TRINITY_DN2920_c1_g1_i1.p1  ORF type:complete len:691 (+),score=132.33 TRINITY_DN2920_c1_g1_i1:91-2163(+)